MLGFVLAVSAETGFRHPTLAAQWGSAPGFLSFLFISGVVAVGSFFPAIRATVGAEYAGAVEPVDYTCDPKTKSFGPFTASAEMANGRAAMMGLVSLLAVEAVRGAALF